MREWPSGRTPGRSVQEQDLQSFRHHMLMALGEHSLFEDVTLMLIPSPLVRVGDLDAALRNGLTAIVHLEPNAALPWEHVAWWNLLHLDAEHWAPRVVGIALRLHPNECTICKRVDLLNLCRCGVRGVLDELGGFRATA